MDYKIRVAQEARDDFFRTVAYLSETLGNPPAAQAFVDEFYQALEILRKLPNSYPGAQEQKLRSLGYRKAALKNYLVLYRVEEDIVNIVRIVHARQNYARFI